ncbi:MAG: hypothetical protein AB7Q17_03085 [Phycisphaerae bacterium]
MRMHGVVALGVFVLAFSLEARAQTCCCHVFTQSTALCPDCNFKSCWCEGGACPGYSEVCNWYYTPFEHIEGVSLAYDQTFCKWISECKPEAGIGTTCNQQNPCREYATVTSGTMSFPYAWEACPL